MSRSAFQLAGIALLLGACGAPDHEALDTGDEAAVAADDVLGETNLAKDLPPVSLPYQAKIDLLGAHLYTRSFIVPRLASLQVLATVWWNRPSPCAAARRFAIFLHRAEDDHIVGLKEYPTNAKTWGASFQNLQPGKYYLDLRVEPPDAEHRSNCWLIGGVNVTL